MGGKKNVVGEVPSAGSDAGAVQPQPAAPAPEPAGGVGDAGAKPAARQSLAAKMMTRGVAGKTPSAGKRPASAAQSSGKPVTGGRGNSVPRRGASKGR